jgi:menaquinone-dependent protoporphyrinogen IX oxidase
MSIQIVYYSKHGSTREITQRIGKKLSAETISDIRELKEITGDIVIVGSAIYGELPHNKIMHLLKGRDMGLGEKQVALFVVCLAKERRKIAGEDTGGPIYLKKMGKALGKAPLASKVFGGRLIISTMDEQERKGIEEFCRKRGMPIVNVDTVSEREIDEFVQEIKVKMGFKERDSLKEIPLNP